MVNLRLPPGFLGALWDGMKVALAGVSNTIWRALCAIAAVGMMVQQARIEGLVLRPHVGQLGVTMIDMPGWRPRALAAEGALAQVRSARQPAVAAQAAVNHQPAVVSAAIAKASDNEAQLYYAQGRAAGAAYAVAHGLRAACPDSDAANADLRGTAHAAPVDDRPGDVPLDVTVSRADFDRFVVNSLRLAKVHQDAESLIAAGVAVPAPEK